MDSSGDVAVLSVGAGDVRLTFDPANPAERIRAARIVKDMLRRGYALLVEVEIDGKKAYQRALDFDEEHCEYIVADLDPMAAQPNEERTDAGTNEVRKVEEAPEPKPAKKGRPRRGLRAERTNAVAVAPTAGG